jgi:hypothetical protein
MAVETLMSMLLVENGKNSEQIFSIAKSFVADTHLRVKMLAEEVLSHDAKSIDESMGILK